METINSLLKELPYKIESKNITYYLVISKCFKGFIVRYWDYDTHILIKQEYKTLLGSLIKTKEALQILKELKEIK
jgi:hypothetical protein